MAVDATYRPRHTNPKRQRGTSLRRPRLRFGLVSAMNNPG
jgi:hypothetical protein